MKKLIAAILYTLFVLIAVVIAPSLMTFIIAIIFVLIMSDLRSKRLSYYIRTMNSAIRIVVEQGDGLEKVIAAFSRSGPLRWQCYEYLQRLRAGQEPIRAAAISRVPLELSTAIAISLPHNELNERVRTKATEKQSDIRDEILDGDATLVPVYGQFVYLVFVTFCLLLILNFMMRFIAPSIEKMLEEFNGATGASVASLNDLGLGSTLLFPVSLLIVFTGIVLFSRGRLLPIMLPAWFPATPRDAANKSDLLCGLAEAIELGVPLPKALAVGHSLSATSYSQSDVRELIVQTEKGVPPVIAMENSGWINAREAAWLMGAAPTRMAELMRTIAEQRVRDANANARWFMELFFPIIILLLGAIVMAYASSFFSALTQMITNI